ncbi:DNA-binding transcriptional regulator [Pseudomonas syringae pv. actinidiae]|uniref:DNA-binding transcriptional regulator n=1 Tax=Pseudomonas syringae pv. actinidiae TaxID=103796 RepID=A0A2V0QJ33_PSESF|nr:DNA-binding transcriptional regulator [Pseudomonas syringae pv. actinidiae]
MIQNLLDNTGDFQVTDTPIEKCRHSHFIGCVEHGGRTAASLGSLTRQPQARKALLVGLLKIQLTNAKQIQWRDARVYTCRPRQCIGNGRTHVGITQLGQHRAINVIDQRVDHALRVNHHLDLIRACVEQPAGFDQLQPLVHHGRRIDRNLAPH